jgi:hypothetical protein
MIMETEYAWRPTFEKGDMWVVSEPAKNEFKPEVLKWLWKQRTLDAPLLKRAICELFRSLPRMNLNPKGWNDYRNSVR